MGRVRSDVNSGLVPSPCGPATWPPRTKPSVTHQTAECRRWKGSKCSHWAQRSRFTAGETKAEGKKTLAQSPTAPLDRAVHPLDGAPAFVLSRTLPWHPPPRHGLSPPPLLCAAVWGTGWFIGAGE